MSLRLAIVGPGRVGQALARRFARHPRVHWLGFVGRDAARTAAALARVGSGEVLAPRDLQRAHVVVFAVGDGQLASAIATCAAASPRPCSLWLHTSGRFGPEVFAAVPGVRAGALHPVAPFPDPLHGDVVLAGAPAVIDGDERSLPLLARLCDWLELQPLRWPGGDRQLYHAACALAANGATALWAEADAVFAACGMQATARAALLDALVGAAAAACRERGAVHALSGPVRRGDAATVQVHLQALAAGAPTALPSYVALMQIALRLATAAGLPASTAAAVAAALQRGR